MKREHVVIKTFTVDKPGQTKIFEVRLPRGLEKIIGVELSSSFIKGRLSESAVGTGIVRDVPRATISRALFPIAISRNLFIGELRLQNVSKANLFYAGELCIDRNPDNADFTSQFFAPKIFTHQGHSFETEVKITAKNRVIRGIYRDKLYQNIPEGYIYKVAVYIWTEKKETKPTEEK